MPDFPAILDALADTGVAAGPAAEPHPVGGGGISAAWCVDAAGERLFLKTGPSSSADMFDAEGDGLREIASSRTVRVPRVLATGTAGGDAFLALEWLDLADCTPATEARLGGALASMHRVTAAEHGWHRDNTLGSTPQVNRRAASWLAFFAAHRLGYQLDLAVQNGCGRRLEERGGHLLERLGELLGDHEPAASLLHGDLWGGNHAACGGEPVLFDPAVYYGDRETDLAMARLFGGFSPAFHAAYEAAWPLPDGHLRRRPLYQLYHVLNHFNLFGDAYRARAAALAGELLDQL